MDESLQELENELKRLTPRRPSDAFFRTLEAELGAPALQQSPARDARPSDATSPRSWKWAGWSLAGAMAAAAAFVVALQPERATPGATTPTLAEVAPAAMTAPGIASTPIPVRASSVSNRYEPVQASSMLYGLNEDGATTLSDQTAARQVRYRYVDTYTWRNPATNASLRWSVPRDEVRVIRTSVD